MSFDMSSTIESAVDVRGPRRSFQPRLARRSGCYVQENKPATGFDKNGQVAI
jgi:hypothetical protein